MSTLLQGLQFHPGRTIIHKLDPRIKLIISILLLTTTLMYLEVTVITIVIIVEAMIAYVARVVGRWAKTVYGAAPLIALVFLMNYTANVFMVGEAFNLEGLYRAFAAAYRLVALLAAFSVFFLTTTPEELGMALTKLKVPYIYTFAFISAIRFAPVLAQELNSILDAQRSRGLELDKGGPITRARRYIPVLVPLLVSVLRRSYELAEAMEVKCFGAKKERTYLKTLRLEKRDYIALSLTLTLFTLSTYTRLMVPLSLP